MVQPVTVGLDIAKDILITYGFFRTFGNELAVPNRGQVVVGTPQPSTEPETTNEPG